MDQSKELIKKLEDTKIFNSNCYLKKYCSLITNNKNRKRNEGGKTQLHHILPRAYFKLIKQNIDESKENKVNLLYADHLYAHYLLACSCNDPKFFYILYAPLKIMLKNKKLNQEQLKQIKILKTKYFKELKKLEQTRYFNQLQKDQKFYDEINSYFKKGISSRKIDRIKKINSGQTKALYADICNRYGWKSFLGKSGWPHYTNHKKNIEFYNIVNIYLQQGLRYKDIDKKLNKQNGYTDARYCLICKKYNKENLAYKSINLREKDKKQKYLEFYNLVNYYLSKHYRYLEIDEILNVKKNFTRNEYIRICHKYNLENKNNNINWNKSSKEYDLSFYKQVSEYIKKGYKYEEISSIFKKSKNWINIKYLKICKEYNLPNLKKVNSF